jgi:DNA-binding transcriptional LysR family regulator
VPPRLVDRPESGWEAELIGGDFRIAGVALAVERGGPGLELRQLRYFVTLAEELHFGHAAAREHIVQSALSQQVQRLERELGVRLLERSTHHVELTEAGAAFLVEARQILARVDQAVTVARGAAKPSLTLRVGVVDADCSSMPQILQEVQDQYPDLVVHQVETGVPRTVAAADRWPPRCGHRPGGVRSARGGLRVVPPGPVGGADPRRSPVHRHAGRTGDHPRRVTAAVGRRRAGAGVQPVRG